MTATASIRPRRSNTRGGKYIAFALGHEEYGVEILKVREIFGLMDITAVPRMPVHVRGVINLRGRVISVIDLRSRFEMPAIPGTDQTCIIVVEVNLGARLLSVGLIVDRVLEVLNIPAEKIDDVPSFGTSVDTSCIFGMARIGTGVKILLDVDTLLTWEQAKAVSKAAEGDEPFMAGENHHRINSETLS